MGIFAKAVKKAQARAKEEHEVKERRNQSILSLQNRLDLVYSGWMELLEELIGEANHDLTLYNSRGRFEIIRPEEDPDQLLKISGFEYDGRRFVLECHQEYPEGLDRKIFREFVYYFEKGQEKSSERHIIKARDALGAKPFLGKAGKPVPAREFFISTISDAIHWWDLLLPGAKAG